MSKVVFGIMSAVILGSLISIPTWASNFDNEKIPATRAYAVTQLAPLLQYLTMEGYDPQSNCNNGYLAGWGLQGICCIRTE